MRGMGLLVSSAHMDNWHILAFGLATIAFLYLAASERKKGKKRWWLNLIVAAIFLVLIANEVVQLP